MFNTAVAKKIHTTIKEAKYKWGHFDRAKLVLKIPLCLWIETMYVKKVEIFPKRYCGSLWVKLQVVKVRDLTKIVPPSWNRTTRVGPRVRVLDDLIILKVWWTVTLQPFYLKRFTVPRWKDLEFVVRIFSAQKTGSVLKIDFALQSYPTQGLCSEGMMSFEHNYKYFYICIL